MIGIGSVVIYPASMIVPETRSIIRQRSARIVTAIFAFVVLVGSACAPEPTTPSNADLSGVWTSNAHLFALSQIRMTLVQEANGIVSGGWSAKGDGGSGGCPPAVPCDASGHLIGRNTMANINIELLGAGSFEGVVIDQTKLRGALILPAGYDTITFVRTQ